jgi:hypothetical protein
MTFREKVDAFIEKAESEGVPGWSIAPPLYRFLWWLGFEIPPPVFLRCVFVVLFEGVFFALFFGVVFVQVFALVEAAACALGTGLVYGLVAGIQWRDMTHQLGHMPSWDRYLPGITYY